MENVKNHFEEEAREFDQIILKLIPHYHEMLDGMISSIAYSESDAINIIDLGCGTGMISKLLKEKFPDSIITCFDLSENMIEMSKIKLSKFSGIEYIVDDLRDFDFKEDNYNVVISSLALHHLETDEDKKQFYKTIYKGLKPGGVFLNADIVIGSNDFIQQIFMQKWISFMRQHISDDEIMNKWLPKYYEEDRPASLTDHIAWLTQIGFTGIDIIWKYYNFAVYTGRK